MNPAHPSSGALRRSATTPGHAAPWWRRLLTDLKGEPGGADWVNRLFGLGLLVGVGIVLGINYLAPDKRMIALMVASLLVGIAWRVDMVSGIGVLVLALPYPRGTVFGGTNVSLVLLLLLLWLLRISTRQLPRPVRTPVDAPIVALLIAFVISFYNIETMPTLIRALENFVQVLAGVAMFYLVVNNLRRPEHLERVHIFQCISITMVCLLGIFELVKPNAVFIPGWIAFGHTYSEGLTFHNVRVGGPFFDFELLSEYCAINILLVLMLFIRARSGARRLIFGALFGLTFFIMFATVTRGGIMALGAGFAYFLWVVRKRLNFVKVTVGATAVIAAFLAMNFYVAHFTNSGDLVARLIDPQSWEFKDGMPAARAPIWSQAIERWMIHPIIGHGPVYVTERGLEFWYWPHNGYLYVANLVGIVGLACFLWLLVRLFRITRPVTLDLRDPNYARAYLLIAHVQLAVFMIDQMKIDFLRNAIYPFQVWMLFAYLVAAHRLAHEPASATALHHRA